MNIVKVLSAFVGAIIVIGSLGMVGTGAVALSVDDTDGYLTAGPVRITTDSAALVGDDLDIFLNDPVATPIDLDLIGAQVDVDSRNGKAVFVGIGAADDVKRYLADVDHGVDVEVTAAGRVPFIRPIGIALVVAGLLGVAIGGTLTYLGIRNTPSRAAASVEVKEVTPVA